ncbi:MAG: polymer-forming cytoskeletal protein [Clostridia bacterium]|nr:polymer-forming cytoskeletal protein [Clostridia bacterium]
MFKTEKPPVQSKGITVSSNVAETIIGPETKYKGTVTTSKTIRVDGLFEGEIKSGGDVIIGETGVFKGTLLCKTLFNSGLVDGVLTVEDKLECTSIGIVNGEINVKELVLAKGAIFDGKCNMSKANPTPAKKESKENLEKKA